jgi:hypothetical protein
MCVLIYSADLWETFEFLRRNGRDRIQMGETGYKWARYDTNGRERIQMVR